MLMYLLSQQSGHASRTGRAPSPDGGRSPGLQVTGVAATGSQIFRVSLKINESIYLTLLQKANRDIFS